VATRIVRGALVALLVAQSMPAAAQPAGSGDEAPAGRGGRSAEAAARLRRALELYEARDYGEAVKELLASYELQPRPRVLFMLGLSYRQLGKDGKAFAAFERYLARKDPGERSRLAEAEKNMAELRERVAKLTIESNVEGAKVVVDGDVVGTTPLGGPVWTRAGANVVTLEKRGWNTSEKQVTTEPSEHATVKVTMARSEAGTAEPPDGATPARDDQAMIAVWITAGVLAAGAIGMGVLTWSGERQATELRSDPNTPPVDVESIETRNLALGITTGALAGLALTLGGVALYLTLWEGSAEGAAALRLGPASLGFQSSF
jgi:hypothetical protein